MSRGSATRISGPKKKAVFATDAASRRHFGVYWRVIYPGSWLIRLNRLRAIRRRAESALVSGVEGHGLQE